MRFQSNSTINQEADGPKKSPTSSPLSNRARVLEAASELFAEAGFHGTHLREICKQAGTNVAGVCYHFQSKERLYQAVMMEAGRQLSDSDKQFVGSNTLLPEQRLLALTESLLQRLGARRAWIAKLLARELVDHADNAHSYAASRLERDFVLLQAVMRELLETKDHGDAVRLHALTLIGECVFYSLTGENGRHPLSQIAVIPSTRTLARFLTQRTLRALRPKPTERDASDFNL
jgi:TetR/AcrR family transcriptional regulator, regulator of cefoperazone and chloramphenicol sensitivity